MHENLKSDIRNAKKYSMSYGYYKALALQRETEKARKEYKAGNAKRFERVTKRIESTIRAAEGKR